MEACGVIVPESAEGHAVVIRCLRNANDDELDVTDGKLDSFRSMRNEADYRLKDRRFAQSSFVLVQVKIAREIADAVRAAQGRMDALAPPMQRYARDTLKLPVRSN